MNATYNVTNEYTEYRMSEHQCKINKQGRGRGEREELGQKHRNQEQNDALQEMPNVVEEQKCEKTGRSGVKEQQQKEEEEDEEEEDNDDENKMHQVYLIDHIAIHVPAM